MNHVAEWKKEESAQFKGWDFSRIRKRMIEEQPPWNYNSMAKKLLRKSGSVLDMGTGGGELFSTFAPFPKRAVATEGYAPNYLLAKKSLVPLGVKVVKFSNSTTRKMPFRNAEFDLVLNKHDAFNAKEVLRILKSGGTFLTQQVDGKNLADLSKTFNATAPYREFTYKKMLKFAVDAGFEIQKTEDWVGKAEFKDLNALIYFLRAVPWIVPGFSVETHCGYLKKLQNRLEKGQRLIFTEKRYLILAKKN